MTEFQFYSVGILIGHNLSAFWPFFPGLFTRFLNHFWIINWKINGSTTIHILFRFWTQFWPLIRSVMAQILTQLYARFLFDFASIMIQVLLRFCLSFWHICVPIFGLYCCLSRQLFSFLCVLFGNPTQQLDSTERKNHYKIFYFFPLLWTSVLWTALQVQLRSSDSLWPFSFAKLFSFTNWPFSPGFHFLCGYIVRRSLFERIFWRCPSETDLVLCPAFSIISAILLNHACLVPRAPKILFPFFPL